MTKSVRPVVQTLFLSLLFASLSVTAQELTLEEIVVTATKRAKSVQDVPVAVSAIDQDTIEAGSLLLIETFLSWLHKSIRSDIDLQHIA